jgi:hypothetical protein
MAKSNGGQDKPTQFFVDCDERSGSLYLSLLKEAPAMARQGRIVISIKAEQKTESRRDTPPSGSKKGGGSRGK